ncbi:MAG TPA: heparinase II/III family protein [Bacteroidales bacterium]|nr:heparinase II/III family protein [Bacteroidales bacterium]
MTDDMRNAVLANAKADTDAKKAVNLIIERAGPWMNYSYDQLWQMMFGNTIKRSWMVWSDGYCPSCKKPVPMYDWQMDPHKKPWKVTCPHCHEDFPKNDFGKFYGSGLNENGIFDPSKADRSLLFNAEHPDPADPLHGFGIDDGEGWSADGHRWRFIGAYLIYGHWKGLIVKGITCFSEAYIVTGDAEYARRAGILLDRVADLYPSHDFGKQGLVYENSGLAGYVSTWHDACQETREMAIAFDMIRDEISADNKLAEFLSDKQKKYNLPEPKSTPADLIRNIENGIILDPQKNRGRIYSNYPQTDMTLAILKKIENTKASNDSVTIIIDSLIRRATSIDGLTGEKGLTGYSAYGSAKTAEFLSLFSRCDKQFLPSLIARHPGVIDMYRFYIDTWCGMKYYPNIGDCGSIAQPDTVYAGVNISKEPGLKPSVYSFLWELYKITGDPDFVKVIYNENGNSSEGLPYDLFASSPEKIRKETDKIIIRYGKKIVSGSVNKEKWHLAILKGNSRNSDRAFWMDYDAGGYHSHADGLNIGLFAYGLDLLPDFGYPPVQFGGWESEKAKWYTMTAAHNTVVVDGKDQMNLAGKYQENKGFMGEPAGSTTLWADGKILQAVSADIPGAYNISRYSRTDAIITTDDGFYIIDIFNVEGGKNHARMTYTLPGDIKITGIHPVKGNDYGHGALLRNFMTDSLAAPGWTADWTIDDRHKLSKESDPVHLRLTDLTDSASVSSAEAWITSGIRSTQGEWIPAIVTQRAAKDSLLSSTFLSVLEPYCVRPVIKKAEKIAGDGKLCSVEITLYDGTRDLFITSDDEFREMNFMINENTHKIRFKGRMMLIRLDSTGSVRIVSASGGGVIEILGYQIDMLTGTGSNEIVIEKGKAKIISGEISSVRNLKYNGKQIPVSKPEAKQNISSYNKN